VVAIAPVLIMGFSGLPVVFVEANGIEGVAAMTREPVVGGAQGGGPEAGRRENPPEDRVPDLPARAISVSPELP